MPYKTNLIIYSGFKEHTGLDIEEYCLAWIIYRFSRGEKPCYLSRHSMREMVGMGQSQINKKIATLIELKYIRAIEYKSRSMAFLTTKKLDDIFEILMKNKKLPMNFIATDDKFAEREHQNSSSKNNENHSSYPYENHTQIINTLNSKENSKFNIKDFSNSGEFLIVKEIVHKIIYLKGLKIPYTIHDYFDDVIKNIKSFNDETKKDIVSSLKSSPENLRAVLITDEENKFESIPPDFKDEPLFFDSRLDFDIDLNAKKIWKALNKPD